MNNRDTIVAPSTPYGESGLAVIRLSGDDALVNSSFLFNNKKLKNRYAHHCKLYSAGQLIDDVIVTFFKAPHSFTGENIIEISCHGSVAIVNKIIKLLISADCRLAEPGEFTKRAFLNGKIDLLQAESIASIISSKSEVNIKNQQRILSGELSNILIKIRNDLINLISFIEHQLDINEEDEIDQTSKLVDLLTTIISPLLKLKNSYNRGKMFELGIKIAITGKPNVGKSTLFNALIDSDHAITSNLPGTTRDILTSEFVLQGVPITLYDTAGIRESDNIIERMGVEKALKLIKGSDINIVIFDSIDKEALNYDQKKSILILNKCDNLNQSVIKKGIVHCSIINSVGIDIILDMIIKKINTTKSSSNSTFISSFRQSELINNSYNILSKTLNIIKTEMIDLEIISFELRESLSNFDVLLGKTTPDDIINNIFSKMCVGK